MASRGCVRHIVRKGNGCATFRDLPRDDFAQQFDEFEAREHLSRAPYLRAARERSFPEYAIVAQSGECFMGCLTADAVTFGDGIGVDEGMHRQVPDYARCNRVAPRSRSVSQRGHQR